MGVRILQSCFLVPFFLYYLFINILGLSPPSGYVSYIIISVFLMSMVLEVLHMVMIYIMIILNLISLLMVKKSKKESKGDSKEKIHYVELTNQIIYFSILYSNESQMSLDKFGKIQKSSIIKSKNNKIKKTNLMPKQKKSTRLKIRYNKNK